MKLFQWTLTESTFTLEFKKIRRKFVDEPISPYVQNAQTKTLMGTTTH